MTVKANVDIKLPADKHGILSHHTEIAALESHPDPLYASHEEETIFYFVKNKGFGITAA